MNLPASRRSMRHESSSRPLKTRGVPGPLANDDMRAHAAEAVGLLKVLAHESRLLVLCHLSDGELSVGEINQRVPLSQSALSQHLAVLRREGMVVTRRQGHSIFYRLADTGATQVLGVLYALYCGSSEEKP